MHRANNVQKGTESWGVSSPSSKMDGFLWFVKEAQLDIPLLWCLTGEFQTPKSQSLRPQKMSAT